MLENSFIVQSYVTQEVESNLFYLRLVCVSDKAVTELKKMIDEFNITTKYFTSYMISDEPQEYKVQALLKIDEFNLSYEFKDNLAKMVESNECYRYISSLSEDFVFSGHFDGGSVDYPMLSYSRPSEDPKRKILLGSLWEFIYKGMDSEMPDASVTEMILRQSGFRQGLRIAEIAISNFDKDSNTIFEESSFEAKKKIVPYVNNIVKSYSYALIKSGSIEWNDEKQHIESFVVSDSYFNVKERESGFCQGLFTAIFQYLFENVRGAKDVMEYYIDNVDSFGGCDESRKYTRLKADFRSYREDTFGLIDIWGDEY